MKKKLELPVLTLGHINRTKDFPTSLRQRLGTFFFFFKHKISNLEDTYHKNYAFRISHHIDDWA